ncbi:MAG: hypothetical protein N3G18_09120 [Candidatus Saccharicenans sp.]|nr:hypothetical protein [Candidatus Saccharicenans sp.]
MKKRLTGIVRKCLNLPAQKMIELILSEVDNFSEGQEPEDDRTLVIVKNTSPYYLT